ncbi:uncharacterized protein LOC135217588 [Macrobrachium nipponense]|uniref:uncharacterized protein LOC135217588 n=1 Tax=Macrobrachium nipponense TaxID=159736 RepID=UPI0030C7F31B
MSNSETFSEPLSIYWSKPVTRTLIELYRQNLCLWNVKLKSYKNRDKRITSLKAIAAEIREQGAAVTTDDIKKNIDTLRNQFRREFKKMKDSQRSGAGTDNLYSPKLWCYDDLAFLTDSDTIRPSVSNMDRSHSTEDGHKTSGDTSDSEVDLQLS